MAPSDTRTQILDAAERLFAERGFRGTSVRAITDSAGANLAAVGYHFGSKAELLTAVIRRVIEPITAAQGAGLDHAADDRGQELRLRAEVVSDGGQVRSGAVGDRADRGAAESALGEEAFGRVEELGAGVGWRHGCVLYLRLIQTNV